MVQFSGKKVVISDKNAGLVIKTLIAPKEVVSLNEAFMSQVIQLDAISELLIE